MSGFREVMQKIKIALAFSIVMAISACATATATPILSTATAAVITTPTQVQPAITLTPTQAQAQVKIPQTADEVPRVSLANAKAAYDNQSAIFIDTRSKQTYIESHIKGALYIGDFESDAKLNADKNQWIITYCTWQNEHTSARVALDLLQKGYTHVNPILGGFQAWVDAGYPIESYPWKSYPLIMCNLPCQ